MKPKIKYRMYRCNLARKEAFPTDFNGKPLSDAECEKYKLYYYTLVGRETEEN